MPKNSRAEVTLYRKYRPAVFKDVVGQDHVLRVLGGAFAKERVAHAYLFAGPRGTGKTTTARLVAKRLNCERAKSLEACNKCPSCQAMTQGAHLDLIEIDAASHRGIDDIRMLKERINLHPAQGPWKIYIVDEVHMLSKDAFNALLKTLEEPPPHAIFILATTELEKVPDTVRSRCQTLIFRRAPIPVIVKRLQHIAEAEGIKAAPNALRNIAAAASGCFRDAESLLAMVAGISEGPLTETTVTEVFGVAPLSRLQDFVDALLAKDAKTSVELVRSLSDEGYSMTDFLNALTRYLRALATWTVTGTHAETLTSEEEQRFEGQAHTQLLAEHVALIRLALRAKYELRDAAYDELPLELLALEWCSRGTGAGGQTAIHEQTHSAKPSTATVRAERPEQDAVPEPRPRSVAKQEAPTISMEDIAERWAIFLRSLFELHPLLLPMLGSAIPVGIRENVLYLVSDHALAHDRMNNVQFRQQVEERLTGTFGHRFGLRLIRERDLHLHGYSRPHDDMQERYRAAAAAVVPATDASLADAMSILGGEVIDERTAAA